MMIRYNCKEDHNDYIEFEENEKEGEIFIYCFNKNIKQDAGVCLSLGDIKRIKEHFEKFINKMEEK